MSTLSMSASFCDLKGVFSTSFERGLWQVQQVVWFLLQVGMSRACIYATTCERERAYGQLLSGDSWPLSLGPLIFLNAR